MESRLGDSRFVSFVVLEPFQLNRFRDCGPSFPRARRRLLCFDLQPTQVVRSLHEEDDFVIAFGEWD